MNALPSRARSAPTGVQWMPINWDAVVDYEVDDDATDDFDTLGFGDDGAMSRRLVNVLEPLQVKRGTRRSSS